MKRVTPELMDALHVCERNAFRRAFPSGLKLTLTDLGRFLKEKNIDGFPADFVLHIAKVLEQKKLLTSRQKGLEDKLIRFFWFVTDVMDEGDFKDRENDNRIFTLEDIVALQMLQDLPDEYFDPDFWDDDKWL